MKKTKIYDISRLQNAIGNNKSYLAEIIGLFINQVPEGISKIEKAIVNKNWEAMHHEVHRMKSTFALFGMNEQREQLIQMEVHISKKNNLKEITNLINKVSEKVNFAIEGLKKEKL